MPRGKKLTMTNEEMADRILDVVEEATASRRGYLKGQETLARKAGIPQWTIAARGLIPLAQQRALEWYPGWAFVVEWRAGKYYLSQANSMNQMRESIGNLKGIATRAVREGHMLGEGIDSLDVGRAEQQELVAIAQNIQSRVSDIELAIEQFSEMLESVDKK